MKSISYWAKLNPRKARLLITLSEISLFTLAARLGLLLLHTGAPLPDFTVMIPVSVLCISLVIARYSNAQKQHTRRYYLQQRLRFFLMGLSMFLFTVFITGSEKLLTWNTYSAASGAEISLLMKPAPAAGERFSTAQLRKMAHLLRKAQKDSSLNGLYIALTIIVTLLLLYVIAALSCTIACNGNEALAWVVLLLGGGGVIFLCIRMIRRILKGKKKKKAQTRTAMSQPEEIRA